MPDIVEELRAKLGEDAVTPGAELRGRARHVWDPAPLEALARVRPRTTSEVAAVMRLCHARGQPVVVHGGLTGLSGAERTTARELILALERMAAIEEIDELGRTITSQAGCTLQALREAADARGLMLPLDLGARGSCTIGGNVATNAGGINVIRHGMARAMVLGLEAVLADGTVVSSMNRMLKNNTGYDLKQLFIGSEGTLGVVTRVVLALKEKPRSVATALVALDDPAKLGLLLRHVDARLGGTLSSFEAMWNDFYAHSTAPGRHVAPLGREHACYAIVEAQGSEPQADEERFESAIAAALESGLVVDAVLPKSGAERERIWAIRESVGGLGELRPVFTYDVSLPIRDMPAYVATVRAALAARFPAGRLLTLGHLGDGNLHFVVSPGAGAEGARAALHDIADRCVYAPLERIGGAISAEHGVGLDKKGWMPITRSAAEIELMRLLKRTLDPKNILNPGKVVDA
jgi:FAD/FMN-containing dehydrogenase